MTVSATQNVNNFKFGRDQLIALNPGAHGNVASTFVPVDLSWVEEMIKEGSTTINNNTIRRRRRGKRGGIRARLKRRGTRTPLPVIVFGNVRSLRNKTDELCANCKYLREYRESAVICLTESWLEEKDSDGTVLLDGFTMCRSDRKDTSKQSGGGVASYVNDKWSNQVLIRETFCDDNIEYMQGRISNIGKLGTCLGRQLYKGGTPTKKKRKENVANHLLHSHLIP